MNIISAIRVTEFLTNAISLVGLATDSIIREDANNHLHGMSRSDAEMVDAANDRAIKVSVSCAIGGVVSIGDTVISHLTDSDTVNRASSVASLGCAILNLGLIADTTIKDAKLRKTLKDKEAGHNVH